MFGEEGERLPVSLYLPDGRQTQAALNCRGGVKLPLGTVVDRR